MLQKIKNFFRPRRKSVRTLDKLSIAERQRYKSLIPSLFGEFIEEIPLEKKRSNSLNKNYSKLTLDLDPLKYSISGEIIKKKYKIKIMLTSDLLCKGIISLEVFKKQVEY